MIKNHLLALIVLVACTLQAQVVRTTNSNLKTQEVDIPDENFFNALIDSGVDTNADGEISFAEAEAVKKLDVSHKSITDLKGIKAFANLEVLSCGDNQLTSLDLSNNAKLFTLNCSGNSLISLDMSNNIKLRNLECINNQLTNLDVTKNVDLTYLFCSENQLTTLNVTQNKLLNVLWCGRNELTELNLTKNTSLENLICSYNPNLTALDVTKNKYLKLLWCNINGSKELDLTNNPNLKEFICASETLQYLYIKSETNFFEDWTNCEEPSDSHFKLYETPNIKYICADESELECVQNELNKRGYTNCTVDTNCSLSIYNEKQNVVQFYPNPVNNTITINSKEQITAVSFIDISGRLVKNTTINSNLNANLNVSNLSPGSYFVKIKTVNNTYIKRVIKK